MARTSVAIVFAGGGGVGAMTAGTVLLRAAAHGIRWPGFALVEVLSPCICSGR